MQAEYLVHRPLPRRGQRHRVRLLLGVLLTLALVRIECGAAEALQADGAPSRPSPSVVSIALTVSDMQRAIGFYTGTLTFRKTADRELSGSSYDQVFGLPGVHVRAVRIELGTEALELLQFISPRGRPIPRDSRSNDRWFQHVAIVVRDMDAAYARLRARGVEPASVAPQRLPDWNPQAGGIEAFYFKDPDGHTLEIIHFPPGKGLARWQVHSGPVFLGIDHSAIVVSDTQAALHYYRDLLGLHVVGSSENYGIEQERLNNVAGAHLRITALRGSSGPGVEFLEYLSPRDGRPAPADGRPDDLWYWQIDLALPDAQGITRALHSAHVPTIAAAPVAIAGHAFGTHDGLIARDPDGHAAWLGRPLP